MRNILLILSLTILTSCATIDIDPSSDINVVRIEERRDMTELEKKLFVGCGDYLVDVKRGDLHYVIVFCKDLIKLLPAGR